MLVGLPIAMNCQPVSLDEAPQIRWLASDRATNVETPGWLSFAMSVNLLPETG